MTLWFCWSLARFSPFLVSMETNGERGKNRRRSALLYGLLVLLVSTYLLTGLFALFASLALLVFVPPVAVTLLAVMPPSATAANERRKRRV